MSTAGAAHSTAAGVDADDPKSADVVSVHSCTRIGRRANPPGFSLLGWLRRLGRRRR
jgi:hypothetical protein